MKGYLYEAGAFIPYLNGMQLKNSAGEALTLTALREGNYYDAILQNISDALNAMVNAGEIDPAASYAAPPTSTPPSAWATTFFSQSGCSEQMWITIWSGTWGMAETKAALPALS